MIIVNFSTQSYARPQGRLVSSVRNLSHIMYTDYAQINSPTHQESPYEFKVHAIEKAASVDPVVLWADSSMWLAGDISKIQTIIEHDGFFGEEAGHYAGRWCNEHTRKYFNLTDGEAHQGLGGITLFTAGLLGLDFEHPTAYEFFQQWKDSALAGCFRGSWDDHRHDMTCASIIATRLGFKFTRGGSHVSYIGPGYNKPEAGSVFYCQGMP